MTFPATKTIESALSILDIAIAHVGDLSAGTKEALSFN
jgi:hypothetical protein